jgi:hypothetical protein
MPLDPSVLTGAGPKPIDIGSLIDMARGKQRLDAESSLGGIIGQATNPDGSIDAGKLGRLAPQAGVMAPEMAARAQQFQANQNVIDRGKLDNLREWWKTQDQAIYPLINDPDLSHGKVLDAIHGLVGHRTSMLNGGIFTPELAVQAASQFYGPGGQPLPPDQIRKKLGQHHAQVLNALEQSQYVKTGVDDQGRDLYMTQAGAIARDAAIPRPRNPAAGGAGGAGFVPQPGGAPATPFSQGPAFGAAAPAIGAASAASANHLTEANDTSMVRKGMLGNLEDDIEKFTSGPTADWTRVGKAWVNRNVPLPEHWKFDPQSIASQEEFNKQAAMLAQSQFAAIGGTGTDAKFESAFTTSPNETLSKLGNKGIIRLLKGNEDAIQAKNAAWRKWIRAGHGPETYADFADEFNAHFDPRAFQFKYIPKAEQQAYINKMAPEERQRFKADIDYARAQGWVRF